MIRSKSREPSTCQAWLKDIQESGIFSSAAGAHATVPPPSSGVSLEFLSRLLGLSWNTLDGDETTGSIVGSGVITLTAKAKKCR